MQEFPGRCRSFLESVRCNRERGGSLHSFHVVFEVSCGDRAEFAQFLDWLQRPARAPVVDTYFCRPVEDVAATIRDLSQAQDRLESGRGQTVKSS